MPIIFYIINFMQPLATNMQSLFQSLRVLKQKFGEPLDSTQYYNFKEVTLLLATHHLLQLHRRTQSAI